MMFDVSSSNACLSPHRPSSGGAGVAGGPSGFGSAGGFELPRSAGASVTCAAVRMEAGLTTAPRRTLRLTGRDGLHHTQPHARGLRRVHLWHHQRGGAGTLHFPGHRWDSTLLPHFSLFIRLTRRVTLHQIKFLLRCMKSPTNHVAKCF